MDRKSPPAYSCCVHRVHTREVKWPDGFHYLTQGHHFPQRAKIKQKSPGHCSLDPVFQDFEMCLRECLSFFGSHSHELKGLRGMAGLSIPGLHFLWLAGLRTGLPPAVPLQKSLCPHFPGGRGRSSTREWDTRACGSSHATQKAWWSKSHRPSLAMDLGHPGQAPAQPLDLGVAALPGDLAVLAPAVLQQKDARCHLPGFPISARHRGPRGAPAVSTASLHGLVGHIGELHLL